MQLHIVSLPHTQTTDEYSQCGFTAKVKDFATMMKDQGFRVVLYAGDENSANVDELVAVMPKSKQNELFAEYDWYRRGETWALDWDESLPYWHTFFAAVIEQISKRIEPHDIICLPIGYETIVSAFPDYQIVETGIGYMGADPRTYHVYESYAWMHAMYGAQADGRFFDDVIPPGISFENLPVAHKKDDYFLFPSRLTRRKGYQIAIQACEKAGVKLIVTGIGGELEEAQQSPNVEHVGLVDVKTRGKLFSKARGVFVPTLYLEPFGRVVAEAGICGTPVITTDWGAFPEIVEQGIDGFRCRSMSEFVRAIDDVNNLSPSKIAKRARACFSMEMIGAQYQHYFSRLTTLWDRGFYT
jgi:glycosyltransferase involved in cell wall biosynthesis